MGCASSSASSNDQALNATEVARNSMQRSITIEKAEERGIKLRQLSDLVSKLTRADATLYQIVETIVKPATEKAQCSYVELVATTPQVPKWFVSHWWGQVFVESVKCLTQHSHDRDLGEDVNYWICAYAANQWMSLYAKNEWHDPANSPFAKAMRRAEGTVSLVDSEAKCFTRTWCCAEIWSALQMIEGDQGTGDAYKYDMYTMNGTGDTSVGITDGFAHVDMKRAKHWWSTNKYQREKHFPIALGRSALYVELQKSTTSEKSDRKHILNSILGNENLDADPPLKHERYDELNDMLRGRFAAAAWRRALECDEHLRDYARVLAASRLTKLALSFDSCDKLDDEALRTLAGGLPPTLQEAEFDFNACATISDDSFQTLTELLPRSIRRLNLELSGCRLLGNNGVAALAKALKEIQDSQRSRKTVVMEELLLNFASDGNIAEQTLIDLVEAVPSTVKVLDLNFYGCVSLGDDLMAALARSLPPSLLKFEIRVARCPEVKDAGVESLMCKLPASLKRFTLDLRFCVHVTDASAATIAKSISSPLLPNLTNLEVDFVSCKQLTDTAEATLRQAVASRTNLEFTFWGKDDFNINQ